MLTQLIAVVATCVFSAVVTFVILKLVDATVGLRVSEVEEEHGLDLSQHGEPAYQNSAAPGPAVAGPHLSVPDPSGGAVLVYDRRSGDPVAPARVGRRPAGVLAVGPA